MKRSAVVLMTGLMTVAVAAPAHARDLYMVKDVGYTNGVYYGDFATLAKKGKKVVGAVGAFSSEYVCIKGKVSGGKLRGTYYEYGVPAGKFTRKWVGKGASQRIKGMQSASYNEVRTYLEGTDPRSFIADCRSMT